MQNSLRKLEGPMRTAVILSACLAIIAMTSGLLLAIHLGCVEHPTSHDSQHCLLCQQLLTPPKKPMLDPDVGLVGGTQVLCAYTPQLAEHALDHHPLTSQPRAPPCGSRHVPA